MFELFFFPMVEPLEEGTSQISTGVCLYSHENFSFPWLILLVSCALQSKPSVETAAEFTYSWFFFLDVKETFDICSQVYSMSVGVSPSNLDVCTCLPKTQDPMLRKNLEAAAFRFSFSWSPNSRRGMRWWCSWRAAVYHDKLRIISTFFGGCWTSCLVWCHFVLVSLCLMRTLIEVWFILSSALQTCKARLPYFRKCAIC